jgi:hypothetical protein
MVIFLKAQLHRSVVPAQMRVIIHSIHSQVPSTIRNLKRRFELVVSLDSHLDVSLGGDDMVYPKDLRMIARRTGAHTSIRELLSEENKGGGDLVIAIPIDMLTEHAADVEANLPRQLRFADADASRESVVDFLKSQRGIQIFQSPPRNLRTLMPSVRRASSWMLDVDVDYMEEMQKECYTRIFGAKPGVLQSMREVTTFIRLSKPETITVSEVKLAALRDPGSRFSAFLSALKEMGYEVEEGEIAGSDEEVIRGMAVCKEFYTKVSKSIMGRHIDEMMRGDAQGFFDEEKRAAERFFRTMGYS